MKLLETLGLAVLAAVCGIPAINPEPWRPLVRVLMHFFNPGG